jgi:hypothetical protein
MQLDRLLRGEATRFKTLKRGTLEIDAAGVASIILILGMVYGLCMGSFGLFQQGAGAVPQLLATAGKVPLLFLLTLLVTFPSLYVFNALIGSRLSLGSTLRLIIAAMAIMLAVLASLGTIVAFFSASTTDYSFILLLNVIVFSVSGFLGMKFLLQTLHRLTMAQNLEDSVAAEPSDVPEPGGALDKTEDQAISANVTKIFRIWIVVFGLVGAQMAWVLRPFIGAPHVHFALFRARESNFFEAVGRALTHLLS